VAKRLDRSSCQWCGGRPRPRRLCVRWGPRSPTQKGSGAPKFSAHVYCGQTAGWIKMALDMEAGLSPGDFVLDGDPAPTPQKAAKLHPQFSAHFYCGQTAGCIKMPLGIEVGLRPGDFVLDGDPALLPKKGRSPPIFGPCLLWLRSPISATAELLPVTFLFCIIRTTERNKNKYKSSAVAEMGDHARAKWAKNWGWGCCAPFSGGAGSPSNTIWPGPSSRSISVPSGILIHPAVWPQ